MHVKLNKGTIMTSTPLKLKKNKFFSLPNPNKILLKCVMMRHPFFI